MVDELPDSAHLLWIGPKRMDQVIVYCHSTLEQPNVHVGIAILAYKLLPNNPFPAQLCKAQAAISTLLSAGTKPENITLTGASARGNLTRFHGILLVSPWVSMQEDLNLPQHCLDAKHQYNSLSAKYGQLPCWSLLHNVPPTQIPFIDPLEVPEDQFNGLSGLVEHGFVIWGEVECLQAGHRRLCKRCMELYHPRIEVYEQVSGIYCQPIWNSAWMGNVRKPRIMEWFAKPIEKLTMVVGWGEQDDKLWRAFEGCNMLSVACTTKLMKGELELESEEIECIERITRDQSERGHRHSWEELDKYSQHFRRRQDFMQRKRQWCMRNWERPDLKPASFLLFFHHLIAIP
ncbi:hypothetical protein EDD18DRAFT_1113193 [Armillaria luteobubalina]|uniref:Uncharacterized protein n=1 Tax=Armillaria luteobubalina TaxID=153913 RepID=A0AA39PBE0_9AGAR|nr:hypothetical protein EDD18DRAFT_1113193 [Armillaria luteobubalina]